MTVIQPIPRESTSLWSPDEFMFQQFRRHSGILTSARRADYFMLSAGANLFPMSQVWKDLLKLEIDLDLAYHWYTSQEGFPTLQRAAKIWETYSATEGSLDTDCYPGGVCITVGASQAVAAIFDYVASLHRESTLLLVGLNYPIFERLARRYRFSISELIAPDGSSEYTLPSAEEVVYQLDQLHPEITVLTVPNNPSGEIYSESDLVRICDAANRTGTMLLIDQVGQMVISTQRWINIGKAVRAAKAQSQVALVSSFSKTDSVPGFRIGYLLGPMKLVRHVARYQLESIMNPATVPILPVFFSFLARCLYQREQQRWPCAAPPEAVARLFLQMLDVTTAIAPPKLLDSMAARLSPPGPATDYDRYVSGLLTKELQMQSNYNYTLSELNGMITRKSHLQGGFNFLVELGPFRGRDEDDTSRDLFEATGIAVLTESCFRVNPRETRDNFWVRISLASPETQFCAAVDRLKLYLGNLR